MRVTLTHPTVTRRKTFTRSQRTEALRHLAVGWRITEPDVQDLDAAFGIAETGSPDVTVAVPRGTVAEVLEWVGSDPGRARAALGNEEASESPRSTLIDRLESIAAGDTDNTPEGEEE